MEPDFHNQFDCFGNRHGFWHDSESYGTYVHGLEEGDWTFLSYNEITWHSGKYSKGRQVGVWNETHHESVIHETLYII